MAGARGKRAAQAARKALGRYDLTDARVPASLPKAPLSVRTALVAVDDPGELVASQSGAHVVRQEGEGRLVARVNRRVDVLENERSHGRVSEAGYLVGRIVQAVFERARGPTGGGQWREGDRVDAATAHELAVIRGIDNARTIAGLVRRMRREIGRIDANLLQLILADGRTFAEVAAVRGRAGARGTSYVAERFRDALEALADQRAARGLGPGSILTWRGEQEDA